MLSRRMRRCPRRAFAAATTSPSNTTTPLDETRHLGGAAAPFRWSFRCTTQASSRSVSCPGSRVTPPQTDAGKRTRGRSCGRGTSGSDMLTTCAWTPKSVRLRALCSVRHVGGRARIRSPAGTDQAAAIVTPIRRTGPKPTPRARNHGAGSYRPTHPSFGMLAGAVSTAELVSALCDPLGCAVV